MPRSPSDAPTIDIGLVHDSAAVRVRGVDQMYTTGRRELVELLAKLGRPATIPDLLESRPKLTQSSVYRNLAILEEVGVVQKVASTDDRARYELSEDLMGHHHHMICDRCGRVDDFVVPPRSEREIERILQSAIGKSGFQPAGHRLDLIGSCVDCG
jgi:Fe2+ or Zn2+ uptake regulation protein